MIVVLVLVLIVMIVVMVVLVLVLIVMIVVMMVLVLLLILIIVIVGRQDLLQHLLLQVRGPLDGIQDHFSVQVGDRGRDDGRVLVEAAQELYALIDLFGADLVGPAQDDGSGICDLVVKELSEVFEVDLALGGVDDSHGAVQMHLGMLGGVTDGAHDIGELADARGLDQDALGGVGGHDLLEGGAEVTDQGAADAAGIHLADLDAGFLEEAAVDTDLAEFVLDQDDLCACKRFLEKLFDQCCLSRTQKSGYDINFRHFFPSFPAQRTVRRKKR